MDGCEATLVSFRYFVLRKREPVNGDDVNKNASGRLLGFNEGRYTDGRVWEVRPAFRRNLKMAAYCYGNLECHGCLKFGMVLMLEYSQILLV